MAQRASEVPLLEGVRHEHPASALPPEPPDPPPPEPPDPPPPVLVPVGSATHS